MRVNVKLSDESINAAIRKCEETRQKITLGCEELVSKLAERGCSVASIKFVQAQYDGSNREVSVTVTGSGTTKAVVATGPAVLFIEFGTGVVYPDDPKIRGSLTSGDVVGRGEYGKGKGKNKNWSFFDEDSQSFRSTQGNPSNGCMYYTREELKNVLAVTAKEVFKW